MLTPLDIPVVSGHLFNQATDQLRLKERYRYVTGMFDDFCWAIWDGSNQAVYQAVSRTIRRHLFETIE